MSLLGANFIRILILKVYFPKDFKNIINLHWICEGFPSSAAPPTVPRVDAEEKGQKTERPLYISAIFVPLLALCSVQTFHGQLTTANSVLRLAAPKGSVAI